MRKNVLLIRRKFTTNTYMKEAVDYDAIIVKEDNLCITIKKYNKMDGKFSLKNEDGVEKDYINEGYYVVELTPLKENYNIRYYFDSNKNFIDYYVDITLMNGIEYKVPYYVDLYLDIIHYPKSNIDKFCDEDELADALNEKKISKKDFNLAYKVGNKLLKEINNKTNRYLNINAKEYIDRYYE